VASAASFRRILGQMWATGGHPRYVPTYESADTDGIWTRIAPMNDQMCRLKLSLPLAQAFGSMYICVLLDSIPIVPEVNMQFSLTVLFAGIVIAALLAIYVPTIYIRKTNKLIKLLEKIETNTRK
jgi:hypothetical protein